MSVDWYVCESCGDNFCDCGYFVGCSCGKKWCDDDCASDDGYIKEEDGESSCKYCRREDFSDSTLLNFLLEKAEISREEVIEEYKKHKRNA